MRRRGWLAIAGSLTVAACSVAADIQLSGSLQRPEAVVTDLGSDKSWRRACVDRLEIRRHDASSTERVWALEAEGEECVWFTRIAYGAVPAGLAERAELKPLEANVRYEVFAHGWTKGFVSVPWVASGSFIYEQGQWKSAEADHRSVAETSF